MKVVKRKLTYPEALFFSTELKSTPNITGFKASELMGFGQVFIAIEGKELIGLAATFDVDGWRDFAVFYVIPGRRGTHVGSKLFREVVQGAILDRANLYISTRTPETLHLIKKYNFKLVRYKELPAVVKRSNLRIYLTLFRAKEYLRKLVKYHNFSPFKYAIKILEK